MLQAGGFYLIGGPGQQSCEVVRVEAEMVPGQPRRIRRHLFRTFGPVSHPAGTWVRRVTVERVFDWPGGRPRGARSRPIPERRILPGRRPGRQGTRI
jgi:hypothetical protein